MKQIIHTLFFTPLITLMLFHNTFYGMASMIAEWATDHRTKKDIFLKHPPITIEKIGENIFLQNITPESYLLKSTLLNAICHLSDEQHINYQGSNREKLIHESGMRIFFSDNPVWYGKEKLIEIVDEENKSHLLNNRDFFLFFNDSLNPSIYTHLIPQEAVKEDRNRIKTFITALKIKKTIISPVIVKNILTPLICFNTKEYLIENFKNMKSKAIDLRDDKIFNPTNNDSFSDYLINGQTIFESKVQYLMNNFNFIMVQKIIGHYFAKQSSK